MDAIMTIFFHASKYSSDVNGEEINPIDTIKTMHAVDTSRVQ